MLFEFTRKFREVVPLTDRRDIFTGKLGGTPL
jgi:hypothetical protein